MPGYIGYEAEYDLGGFNYLEDVGSGIVRSGLVYHIDPGNPNSYPGTGTVTRDLSNSAIAGDLVGTVGYLSQNKGVFNFTGVTGSYVNLGTNFDQFSPTVNGGLFCDSATTFSVSVWYKWLINPTSWGVDQHAHMFLSRGGGIATSAQFGMFGSINSYNIAPGEALIANRAGLVLRGARTVASPININDEIWHNSVITWDGTTAKIYFDGIFFKNAFVGTAGVQTAQVANAVLGNRNATPTDSYRLQGAMSQSLVYNRALNDIEVLQNYNAARRRFGR